MTGAAAEGAAIARQPPVPHGTLCGRKNRNGLPCRQRVTPGWTVCRFHGAGGGRPPTTRLYARHLNPEQLEAFEAADIASLDAEIRLAKANLDWAVGKWQADPEGGVTVEYGKQIKVRLWSDVVREHGDHVRKLVVDRAKLLGQIPPDEDPLADYEAWVAAQQPSGASRSPSPSSAQG